LKHVPTFFHKFTPIATLVSGFATVNRFFAYGSRRKAKLGPLFEPPVKKAFKMIESIDISARQAARGAA
jgi:hypothetical protein